MQDNVEIYTKALIRAFRDSEEYRAFNHARARLSGMPELKKQIHAYRKENFRLHNFGEEDTLFERMEEFRREYEEFRKNPLVEEYLSCELAVCRMLQKAANRIAEGIDLELDDVLPELCI